MNKHKISLTRIFLLIIASTLFMALTGCAGPNYVWYQKGKDRVAFNKDNLECEEESAQYARFLDKRGDQDIISNRMKECMGLRGYLRIREEEVPRGEMRF